MKTQITIKPCGDVMLRLNSRSRNIGTIKDRTLFQNKSKEKHFFKMYSGYGFPYELISQHSMLFDLVSLCIDFRDTYYITPANIMKYGIIKQFGNFENQIFVNQKHLALVKEQALEYGVEKPAIKKEIPELTLFAV